MEGRGRYSGREIRTEIARRRSGEHKFIKWWRRENDFADFELLDEFLARVREEEHFEGFELLDMEDMWEVLQAHTEGRVHREKRRDREMVVWERPQKQGAARIQECLYAPDSLLSILNVETRGNVIG